MWTSSASIKPGSEHLRNDLKCLDRELPARLQNETAAMAGPGGSGGAGGDQLSVVASGFLRLMGARVLRSLVHAAQRRLSVCSNSERAPLSCDWADVKERIAHAGLLRWLGCVAVGQAGE